MQLPEVGGRKGIQWHTLVLSHLDRRAGDVMRLTERNALIASTHKNTVAQGREQSMGKDNMRSIAGPRPLLLPHTNCTTRGAPYDTVDNEPTGKRLLHSSPCQLASA